MNGWQSISGEFYDGDRAGVPEQPWIHDYSKTLTMKIALARPDREGGSLIICSFRQLRDFIRRLDDVTRGIPKILYLVGWQYRGHDTGYPAFHEVNPGLAEEGEDPAEVLREIMEESPVYHTTVSLHINMTDAYVDSPLWDSYVKEDLISRRRRGKHLVTGRWYGRKAYQVCYTREWASGRAVERIDRLMELLPLEKTGTVHIDAFFCRHNRYYGITKDMEQAARRKMIRYWRSRGVDVTSEFLYRETGRDDLIGLVPMVWHLNQRREDYMNRPASLLCGGRNNRDLRGDKKLGRLFGESTHGESCFADAKIMSFNKGWEAPFLEDFFTNALPWQFLNSLRRHAILDKHRRALLEGEVLSEKRGCRITRKGQVLREGDTLCIPALWADPPLLGVFSREGGRRLQWELPPEWEEAGRVRYEPVCGGGEPAVLTAADGRLTLSLNPGEGGWLSPLSGDKGTAETGQEGAE